MATRERPADIAVQDARRLIEAARSEVRTARLGHGLSQAAAARRAGVSRQQWSRLELGKTVEPTLEQLCRVARAVGLEPSFTLFLGGMRVRDRASLAILDRLTPMLAPPIVLAREVGLPIQGDKRAWDARISDGRNTASIECESRIRDAQALMRRIALKQRDDPGAGAILLVLARTRHNREVLREHREALRGQFPLDGWDVARALRAGRVPERGGVILV